jgi:predicted  nucleic acid-binding Zn-ribbon protein
MLLPSMSPLWEHGGELLTCVLVVWATGVVTWALLRLEKIYISLKRVNDLRDPIAELRKALGALPAAELKERLAELKQSSEIVHNQLVELQRFAADERAIMVRNGHAQDGAPSLDKWEQMRTAWTEVRDRLEQIIRNIPDGRLRRKYEGISRYSYSDINNALRNDGFINDTVSEAIEGMNETFLSSRRRSRPVTSDEMQVFKRLKEEFDLEIRRCPVRM